MIRRLLLGVRRSTSPSTSCARRRGHPAQAAHRAPGAAGRTAGRRAARHPSSGSSRRRWRGDIRPCLPARPRRHCLKAEGCTVSIRAHVVMAEAEVPRLHADDGEPVAPCGDLRNSMRPVLAPRFLSPRRQYTTTDIQPDICGLIASETAPSCVSAYQAIDLKAFNSRRMLECFSWEDETCFFDQFCLPPSCFFSAGWPTRPRFAARSQCRKEQRFRSREPLLALSAAQVRVLGLLEHTTVDVATALGAARSRKTTWGFTVKSRQATPARAAALLRRLRKPDSLSGAALCRARLEQGQDERPLAQLYLGS
jgi:hypothetical protein